MLQELGVEESEEGMRIAGINREMFEHSINNMKEGCQKGYKEVIEWAVQEVFKLKANEDTIIDLVVPFGEMNFNINNQVYADYEAQ